MYRTMLLAALFIGMPGVDGQLLSGSLTRASAGEPPRQLAHVESPSDRTIVLVADHGSRQPGDDPEEPQDPEPDGTAETSTPCPVGRQDVEQDAVPGVPGEERRRQGPAFAVYPIVAPATVVVTAQDGHGTGFVVDPEGWIVTNHHVVENGQIDPTTRLQTVTVYVGRLREGFMEPIEQGIPAVVYKVDAEKDLALIRLSAMPAGVEQLPSLSMAAKSPRPGADCVVIGHPAAGMLWTVRSGEIAGAGAWPQDMIDMVMQRLTSGGKNLAGLRKPCEAAGQRRVLISSCGLNPGDSGGPLVDGDGQLIGVSFAIPGGMKFGQIHLDKFSYHVHLDELKAFLANRPESPIVHSPDPWPSGSCVRVLDTNGDDVPDGLVFAMYGLGRTTGFAWDLDQDSRPTKPGVPGASLDKSVWDLECAFHHLPAPRAFYDTDNDGTIDLVLTDHNGDGQPDEMLRQGDRKWESVEPIQRPLIDPGWFHDDALGKRLQESLPAMQDRPLDHKYRKSASVNRL